MHATSDPSNDVRVDCKLAATCVCTPDAAEVACLWDCGCSSALLRPALSIINSSSLSGRNVLNFSAALPCNLTTVCTT
eukprot:363671-Chlamydomonas_euryale.AAC.11